jgi:hypothetical protein
LEQSYQTRRVVAEGAEKNISERLAILTTSNTKLNKENEMIRSNLEEIYGQLKLILVEGQYIANSEYSFEKLVDEVGKLAIEHHKCKLDKQELVKLR